MALNIQASYDPGESLYAVIRRVSDGFVYNGATFEAPVRANWTAYAYALAPVTNLPLYSAAFPTVADGAYTATVYAQDLGAPNPTDTIVRQTYDTGVQGGAVAAQAIVADYVSGEDPATIIAAIAVETGIDLQQALRLILAHAAGNTNVTSKLFKAANNAGTTRIAYTIAPDGSRTVTLTPGA